MFLDITIKMYWMQIKSHRCAPYKFYFFTAVSVKYRQ